MRPASQKACILCQATGEPLYSGLTDWLYGSEGAWDLSYCPRCTLAWLNPPPDATTSATLYSTYYTHAPLRPETQFAKLRRLARQDVLARRGYQVSRPAGALARILSRTPPVRRAAALEVMDIPPAPRGSILDVGCGNGSFVAKMRSLGWDAVGIDPDSRAVQIAQAAQIPAALGTPEDLNDETFDFVTLNHVIEHSDDPIGLLRACRQRLKPNSGHLVATTPNFHALGHRWFTHFWRGLEVPRHLFIFSRHSLAECARRAGLHPESIRTETRLAHKIYSASSLAAKGRSGVGRTQKIPLPTKVASFLFQAIEDISYLTCAKGSGEEIVIRCTIDEATNGRGTNCG